MSMKVLIADPDWHFSQQVSHYLELRAHLVVTESRQEQAAERVNHWRPDLAIVAAEMADDDLMKTLYALNPRPAVLLTGWMDRYALAWKAWQKGGDDLLIKPVFSTDDLHEAIVTAMENAATGTRKGSRPRAAASA